MRKLKKSILMVMLILSTPSCSDTEVGAPAEVRRFYLSQFAPAQNANIDSMAVLTAFFSWDLNVLEFYPDVYFVRFVFEGTSSGDFSHPQTYVFPDMYSIKSVRGSASHNYEVDKIWTNPSVRHPLRVRLELLAKITDTQVRALEQSATIRYTE